MTKEQWAQRKEQNRAERIVRKNNPGIRLHPVRLKGRAVKEAAWLNKMTRRAERRQAKRAQAANGG